MEPDRYKNNQKLYILGIICLVISLTLLFISLYIIPFLIWELNYKVPETVTWLIATFNQDYNFNKIQSKLYTWLVYFIPALITGFIAYYTSNRIDNRIYNNKPELNEQEKEAHAVEVRQKITESAGIGLKIIGLIIIILVILLLFQGFFQMTATSE